MAACSPGGSQSDECDWLAHQVAASQMSVTGLLTKWQPVRVGLACSPSGSQSQECEWLGHQVVAAHQMNAMAGLLAASQINLIGWIFCNALHATHGIMYGVWLDMHVCIYVYEYIMFFSGTHPPSSSSSQQGMQSTSAVLHLP